jgi:hypothetical protein
MVRGYPVRQLQAAYSHPTIDGQLANGEVYTKPKARQVIFGSQTGIKTSADWAYDEHFLYFTARVSDRTVYADGSQPDGVRLLLDVADTSDTRPQQGMFCLFFRRDGSLTAWQGSDGIWRISDMADIDIQVQSSKTQYVIESAIPWSALGLAEAPTDRRMAAAIEMQDRRENTMLTERIPDVRLDESWSWMEFRLMPKSETNAVNTIPHNQAARNTITMLPAMFSGLPLTVVREHKSDGTVCVRKFISKR